MIQPNGALYQLVRSVRPAPAVDQVWGVLELDPRFAGQASLSRAVFAMALNIVLFQDLLERVPTAAAYVADRCKAGEKVVFDHGALRTVRFACGPTGALPPGEEAIRQVLSPLGYELAGVYPLSRLRMTGRAYCHRDFPETIPQFFVSELHVEAFSKTFAAAAARTFGSVRNPLGLAARQALAIFQEDGAAPAELASAALLEIAAMFQRLHDAPALSDYQALLSESPEAAWIATEGFTFNHATDRVADVNAAADAQRALGRPIKDEVEVSGSGRVRQTAFRADPVERTFVGPDGALARMSVPGSFYEFITRGHEVDAQGHSRLDLRFDSSNAQGIFEMTKVA